MLGIKLNMAGALFYRLKGLGHIDLFNLLSNHQVYQKHNHKGCYKCYEIACEKYLCLEADHIHIDLTHYKAMEQFTQYESTEGTNGREGYSFPENICLVLLVEEAQNL